MDVSKLIKSTRSGTGHYIVHTPMGTWDISNCPADRDMVDHGFRSGPRWMLIWPGEYSPDADCFTKGEAMDQIVDCLKWELTQRNMTPQELAVCKDFCNRHADDSPYAPKGQ